MTSGIAAVVAPTHTIWVWTLLVKLLQFLVSFREMRKFFDDLILDRKKENSCTDSSIQPFSLFLFKTLHIISRVDAHSDKANRVSQEIEEIYCVVMIAQRSIKVTWRTGVRRYAIMGQNIPIPE